MIAVLSPLMSLCMVSVSAAAWHCSTLNELGELLQWRHKHCQWSVISLSSNKQLVVICHHWPKCSLCVYCAWFLFVCCLYTEPCFRQVTLSLKALESAVAWFYSIYVPIFMIWNEQHQSCEGGVYSNTCVHHIVVDNDAGNDSVSDYAFFYGLV